VIFGSEEDFREREKEIYGRRRREKERERERERERENSPTFSRWCSATVKILFLADNAETRPNEIAIASANVCIIKK